MGVTNSIPLSLTSGLATNGVAAPDLGATVGSLGRLMGSLALVFAVMLGALWIYRHWQRLLLQRKPETGLRVVDVKNLGQRMAVYVVAYRHQRFLIGGSPNGLTLLSPLESEASESSDPGNDSQGDPQAAIPPGSSFRNALDKALSPSA
ncbi:MAG: FliO/MopB family protein [Verrucomicrobiota bacterium]